MNKKLLFNITHYYINGFEAKGNNTGRCFQSFHSVSNFPKHKIIIDVSQHDTRLSSWSWSHFILRFILINVYIRVWVALLQPSGLELPHTIRGLVFQSVGSQVRCLVVKFLVQSGVWLETNPVWTFLHWHNTTPDFLSLFGTRDRKTDWQRYTEEWSELKVNQCDQTRETSRQTDLLTIVNSRQQHRHPSRYTQTHSHTRSSPLPPSQEPNAKNIGYYLSAVAATVRPVCLPLSVCVFPVCHCIEMGGRQGEAASRVIQMFSSSASQWPTVARAKRGSLWGPDRWP